MTLERDFSRYDVRRFDHSSIGKFAISKEQSGIHSIKYGDGNLDLYVDFRGSKTTFVIFHAAVPPRVESYPVFQGLSVTRNLDCNLIFVSDPVLELGTNLGWYGGDSKRQLQCDLPKVIQTVLGAFDTHENLVFFGPSGGGYASLFFSHQFPGSWAIPMNPQTDITKYSTKAVDAYMDAAWNGTSIEQAPFEHQILDRYEQSFPNKVLYVQNLGDRTHIPKYLVPFLNATKENRASTAVFAGEWGLGHKPAPGKFLSQVFHNVIDSEGVWEFILSLEAADSTSTANQISAVSTDYIRSIQR